MYRRQDVTSLWNVSAAHETTKTERAVPHLTAGRGRHLTERSTVKILERFLNELPVIAVGVWAVLRVVGIDVDEAAAGSAVVAVESIGSVLLMLLVRRSIDGPVTAWNSKQQP